MKRRVFWIITLFTLVVLAVLVSSRQTAHEYVSRLSKEYMLTDSSWGNFEILDVENRNSYVIVKIKYQTKPDFVPKERWFIKDNVKIANGTGGWPTWTGNVYLVQKAFFWWREIR